MYSVEFEINPCGDKNENKNKNHCFKKKKSTTVPISDFAYERLDLGVYSR